MKALLSGANGNLGDHIKKYARFEICPIRRGDWDSIGSKDLSTYKTFIHCAYDLKKQIHESPANIVDSNITSTMKALEICKKNKIEQFLFISSCSVYGHTSDTNEAAVCNPVTINGLTKLLNEEMLLSFCRENNIKPIILRPFNSYGGKDQFSIVSKMIDAAKNGTTIKLYNGGLAERDFIHVSDLAKVVCQFSENPPSAPIINVGTGEAIRIIDIVKYFEGKFGKLKIEEYQNIVEVKHSKADIKQLKKEVNLDFMRIFNFIDNL